MINDKISAIYSLIQSNEEAGAKLAEVKAPEEAVAILAGYGIEISIEELKEMDAILYGEEIPVELLDMVAGGGKKARDFFRGFCDGLHDAFNEIKDIFSFGK